MKAGYKPTFNWNKYQSNTKIQRRNQYLDYLTDPSYQGRNRCFVLSFENNAQQLSYKRYFLPAVEIKEYNVMIDGQNLFDQLVKTDLMITFKKLQLLKKMITQPVVYWIMFILKFILR